MSHALSALAALALLGGSLLAVADPPPATADARVVALVAQLGSGDYAAREAAGKELDALGAAALDRLRAACRSPNPEVARRARDLAARIDRRVGNEKALAPTLVELDAKAAPLADVLADLSKQSGYAVSFNRFDAHGVARGQPAVVTVETGKVAFWEAVRKVCDAADLEIGAASGVVAPEPVATTARAVPTDRTAVRLVPRGTRPKRPSAVFGAVLVEAFEIPKAAGVPEAVAVVLQVWPEPKLNWLETKGVRVTRAADAAGRLFAALPGEPESAPQVTQLGKGGVVMVRQVGGGVVIINQRANVPLPPAPAFTPNGRQVVVKLKPGEKPAAVLAELTGTIDGRVRSAPEPLVALTGLAAGRAVEGSHPAGVEMTATLRKRNGGWEAEVEVMFDQSAIMPETGGFHAAFGDGRKGPPSLLGVRVTDAAGKAFGLTPTGVQDILVGNGNRLRRRWTCTLDQPDPKAGDPDGVAFWGTYAKPVEVPFALSGVPLVGGGR